MVFYGHNHAFKVFTKHSNTGIESGKMGVLADEKISMSRSMRIWESHNDYRAKTTRGVSTVAVILLFPFTFFALINHLYAYFVGGTFLVSLLVATAYLVANSRDHEPLTLYALVPGSILLIAFALRADGISASIGCFPLLIACYCMLSRQKADIASVMILAVSAPMMWLTLKPFESFVLTTALAVVILFASMLMRQIESQQDILKYQIDRDPMTGLLNRTSLNRQLAQSVDAFRSAAVPAALLTIDLDHFKRVNDMFGHNTGDLVLCEVAHLLEGNVSDQCTVFRLGGEEFLLILANKNASEARAHAKWLCASISNAAILQDYPVTVSIGVANLRGADNADTWRRRSDNLLYVAKINGRDQVVSDGDIDTDNYSRRSRSSSYRISANKVEGTSVV